MTFQSPSSKVLRAYDDPQLVCPVNDFTGMGRAVLGICRVYWVRWGFYLIGLQGKSATMFQLFRGNLDDMKTVAAPEFFVGS